VDSFDQLKAVFTKCITCWPEFVSLLCRIGAVTASGSYTVIDASQSNSRHAREYFANPHMIKLQFKKPQVISNTLYYVN